MRYELFNILYILFLQFYVVMFITFELDCM